HTVVPVIIAVRDAIAVTVPTTRLETPPLATALRVALPMVRYDPVARAKLLTAACCPDVLVTSPRPVTRCPYESSTRSRHDFLLRRRQVYILSLHDALPISHTVVPVIIAVRDAIAVTIPTTRLEAPPLAAVFVDSLP